MSNKPNPETVLANNETVLENAALKEKAKKLIEQVKRVPPNIDTKDKSLRQAIMAYMKGDASPVKGVLSGSAKWLITVMDSMGDLLQSISTLAKGIYGGSAVYSAYKVLYLFYSLIFGGCLFFLDLLHVVNPLQWPTLVSNVFYVWPYKVKDCYNNLLTLPEIIPYLFWMLGFFYSSEIVNGSFKMLSNIVGKKQLSEFEKSVKKQELQHKHRIEEHRERARLRVSDAVIPPRPISIPKRVNTGRLSRIRRNVRKGGALLGQGAQYVGGRVRSRLRRRRAAAFRTPHVSNRSSSRAAAPRSNRRSQQPRRRSPRARRSPRRYQP